MTWKYIYLSHNEIISFINGLIKKKNMYIISDYQRISRLFKGVEYEERENKYARYRRGNNEDDSGTM